MEFIGYMFDEEYGYSLRIYILMVMIVTIPAFLSCQQKERESYWNKFYFLLSFLLAWFFYIFSDIGTDLISYLNIFEASNLSIEWITEEGLEPGYKLLNALLHSFISNPYIGVAIIKTLQIGLVYVSIYLLRKEIDVGQSVMAYMSLFYFQAFNLIRLSLAGSICFVSIALLIRKKNVIAFLLSLIAATIHFSAIFFVFASIVYYAYSISGKYKSIFIILICASIPAIIIWGGDLIRIIVNSGIFMDRYEDYLDAEQTFGVAQIIFYIPIILLYCMVFPIFFKERDRYLDVGFVFTTTGFGVAMLGYSLGMLARASIFFAMPFMFLCPYYLRKRAKKEFAYGMLRLNHRSENKLFMGYWIFRFILMISGLFIPSGLYQFKFFFIG